MGRYLLTRVLINIPVLIGITLATYFIINLAPGDPVTAMVSPETVALLGPDYLQQQREQLGLNKPLPVRYVLWLKEIAKGNLGFSLTDRQPIAGKIAERLGPTLKLMGAALLIGIAVAIPLGILSALRQYSFLDYFATVAAFGAISIPSFFLALGAIFIFALKLGWLPVAGMTTVGQPGSFLDSLKHLVLPACILGLGEAAPLIRYTRSSMLEVIRQDYVTTARAKGLRERAVIYRHALRNALIPLVTVVALGLPRLLGGTVIIETVFAWPGMGLLAITAVRGRDYPVIMAINLISAVMIVVSNLLADVIYAVIDPRIKYT
ncbi:MAG: ABC transporter permease [Thermomicrobiales bacterium]|nr:ABC transporter permease [Thermomicrobiales bacterium]